jgi:hypothetical protein
MERMKEGNQRTEQLNERISYRNIPSSQLQPQFDLRPLSTKYAMMPIVDRRENHAEPIRSVPIYDSETTFNPGSAQAPWSGFASNINKESILRNQFFALQKGAGQSCYIPSLNSELYNKTNFYSTNVSQPFPDLFTKPTFEEFNPSPKSLGVNFFENCTRQQIKEIS